MPDEPAPAEPAPQGLGHVKSWTATSAGPGQAPSYKIGERHFLQLRDQARAAEGVAFDLKSFHRRVLDLGSVGLDVLRDAVLDLSGPRPQGRV